MNVGQDFLKANGPRSLWFFTVARWACIPFSLLGGYICFRFGCELYGTESGFLALILWCFCPYILGHASLITPDVPAAAMGITAYYMFWRWLRLATLRNAIVMGVFLGLAELTKTTLLVFYPLWLVTWFVYGLSDCRSKTVGMWFRELAMLLGAFFVSVAAINLGYGFEGSFTPLGEFQFHSALFSGISPEANPAHLLGNRFSSSALGSLLVPLPVNYLLGIDAQRWDFEHGMLSYLCGEWKTGGWWHYYLYALTIKLPLGVWALFLAAIGASLLARGYSASWRDELVLALPAISILALVSSQTGFSIHSRYVVPMLPFAFIWISKVAQCVRLRQWQMAVVVGGALLWSVVSSLWYFPHSLSYFNESVGGPMNGHYHLLDSNIAWGQDLYYLKDWLDKHPEASPLRLAAFGLVDPRLVGIKFTLPPPGPDRLCRTTSRREESHVPQPGWYAIDVNHLHSADALFVDEQGEVRRLADEHMNYRYFLYFKPVANVGYSIYIYHVTAEEAKRVQRELGATSRD